MKSNRVAVRLATTICLLMVVVGAAEAAEQKPSVWSGEFGPFNSSYYTTFAVVNATISNNALQITPDSVGNFSLQHRSGRVFLNQTFKLFETKTSKTTAKVASFNTSFLINLFRVNNSVPGEGFAFLIAPDLQLPSGSDGEYLGLTNSTTDGLASNQFVAVEFDTVKQQFDPDANHIGLNINSVKSNKTVSLSSFNIKLAPIGTIFHMVWIQYDGLKKVVDVYMAEQAHPTSPTPSRPSKPVLTSYLDLSTIVKQNSYFGFSASTGLTTQLNCVIGWNLTVEILPQDDTKNWVKIGLGMGLSLILILCGIGAAALVYYLYRKHKTKSDPNILGALKSLPGMPREFGYKELKKATNNFDEKHKLGQGGFGVVYKGLLHKENLEIAVKKFSRDNINGTDDFLAELTIINRLRHKYLVRLLGWCHKNGVLLLVYDYMPNGSLDNHLFYGPEEKTTKLLEWNMRYKIISGVASALHYLHNDYDQTVVHRDLKASNIMLDSDFNPRLGDFGLARALDNEMTSYAEIEGVPGTIGYIAPECFHTGKATRESDVYAFGAVILEVVCGQRPWIKLEGFQLLVDWVWWLHREGKLLDAVDKRLENNYVKEEAERLLLLGLACSHPIATERPKTRCIAQIVSGSVASPNVPHFKPSFVWPSMSGLGSVSTSSINTSSNTTPMTSGWTPRETDTVKGHEYSDSRRLCAELQI